MKLVGTLGPFFHLEEGDEAMLVMALTQRELGLLAAASDYVIPPRGGLHELLDSDVPEEAEEQVYGALARLTGSVDRARHQFPLLVVIWRGKREELGPETDPIRFILERR